MQQLEGNSSVFNLRSMGLRILFQAGCPLWNLCVKGVLILVLSLQIREVLRERCKIKRRNSVAAIKSRFRDLVPIGTNVQI